MAPRIAMLLGRTIWTRDVGSWQSETFNSGPNGARDSIARLARRLSESPSTRAIAVYEPDGIAHQAVEIPKVNRAAFATLARVRSEFPVVESENLGWGIEYPDAGPSGTYSTMIHSELTPGLIHVRDACVRSGCPLPSVWTAYTAAIACAKSGPSPSKTRFVLMVTPDFSAIATFGGGRRSFKTWTGSMSERDWKAISVLIGDFDAVPSLSMGEAGLRRGKIIVIAEGEPERICPIWGDLCASGRVEAVVDFETFGTNAVRLPASHPANLVDAFPRARELGRFLSAAAIAGFSTAVAFGAAALKDGRRLEAEGAADGAQISSLKVRLRELTDNQREMSRLRNEAPNGFGPISVGRHDALVGLAEAIPDALTLTSLRIGGDGAFEFEALVVGKDFDQGSVRMSLERCGFAPGIDKGWVYESGTGRLIVRGTYGEARP